MEVLLELFQFETVSPEALVAATSCEIYAAFMDTPPPPQDTVRRPELPWATIWGRLWGPRAAREEADTQFQLIHNILPARGRLARFGVEAAGHCPRCPGVIEDLVPPRGCGLAAACGLPGGHHRPSPRRGSPTAGLAAYGQGWGHSHCHYGVCPPGVDNSRGGPAAHL